MIWTEWDKLTEIIVGDVYDDISSLDVNDNEFKEGMHRILEETREDLNKLSELIKSFNVRVYRPKQLKFRPEQTRVFNSIVPYPAVFPRDMHIVYGNQIINTIGGDPNRYNESDFFVEIMTELFNQGRDYISMPKPLLSNDYIDYKDHEGKILYHAANILKCGDTLLYSTPYTDKFVGRGTHTGFKWIKQHVKNVRWAEVKRPGHADGRIALLAPKVLLAKETNLIPHELRDWDVVKINSKALPRDFEIFRQTSFYSSRVKEWLNTWIGNVDETVFDINVLSIDPYNVISNSYDKDIATELKKRGINLIPFNFRHKFFFDGGLHCATLDLSREGERETYVTR